MHEPFKNGFSRLEGFPGGSVVKNLPANAGATGDAGSIPGLGRSPGWGNSNTLQNPCGIISWTEEPDKLQSMGSQSWTWLSMHARTHTHLSKPTECTPIYSEPHCKLWIWGDITCQCKFINYNKYITLLGDTDNRGDLCGGKKYTENIPLNFAVNPTANCC